MRAANVGCAVVRSIVRRSSGLRSTVTGSALATWLLLAGSVASAAPATGSAVADAIAALGEIERDASKLKPYCAIHRNMIAAVDDQVRIDQLANEFEALLQSFGPRFAASLELHLALDDASEDGSAWIEELGRIDALCALP